MLAKRAATLDILAGGRFDLGLGLGRADEENQATGVSKHRRGRRADEFLAVLRALWQQDVAEHHGEFHQVPPTRLAPKPVQRPHPPILLGGQAPAALRRAGRLADGWVSGSRQGGVGLRGEDEGRLHAGRDRRYDALFQSQGRQGGRQVRRSFREQGS
ncbi:LLM class flavin-dependent oxidoreductase [Micromonospora sp. NPDC004540]|uniref:LLM class flavin-dependent oxidoreductase n=1 Tax=Micromonospora sp. NPDC004540 TaxID=3154457 RepID=UPI0033A56428